MAFAQFPKGNQTRPLAFCMFEMFFVLDEKVFCLPRAIAVALVRRCVMCRTSLMAEIIPSAIPYPKWLKCPVKMQVSICVLTKSIN